jgi:hypothetical protein
LVGARRAKVPKLKTESNFMPLRRSFLTGLVALASTGCAQAAPPRELVVYKTATCPCCEGWVDAMAKAGFKPRVVVVEDLTPLWQARGVADELSSCHVATIGDYFTIGHVPSADVERLLKEAPKAIGLSVPGMPFGTPGMEHPDGLIEPFETLLLLKGGGARVFARHG